MSPKRPEFADCLASPSPRTRGLAMPILGFLLCGQLTGCFLIPTVAVSDCVCDMGQICTEGNVCQAKPDGEMLDADMKPPCIYNSECDGSVCEYNSADIMANRCLSMDMLVFVGDPSNCNNVTADGTRQNPYCTINKAIDVVTTSGSGQAIRLLADVNYGSLDSSKFTGKSLTIYGPYEPRPNVNPMLANINLSGSPAVRLNGDNTKFVMDGVTIAQSKYPAVGAVECRDLAKLSLRRTIIRESNVMGLHSQNCAEISVDRTQIVKNAGAIYIEGKDTKYMIQNSLIADNINPGSDLSTISLSGGKGLVRFNTIVNNRTMQYAGAFKLMMPVDVQEIYASIIYNNELSNISTPSQFYPLSGFLLKSATVGSVAQYLPFNVIDIRAKDPLFVDQLRLNYRLVDDTATVGPNSQCCLIQLDGASDLRIDLFGNQRTKKTTIGAVSNDAT